MENKNAHHKPSASGKMYAHLHYISLHEESQRRSIHFMSLFSYKVPDGKQEVRSALRIPLTQFKEISSDDDGC